MQSVPECTHTPFSTFSPPPLPFSSPLLPCSVYAVMASVGSARVKHCIQVIRMENNVSHTRRVAIGAHDHDSSFPGIGRFIAEQGLPRRRRRGTSMCRISGPPIQASHSPMIELLEEPIRCVQPGQRSLRPWQPGDRGAPAARDGPPVRAGGPLMATKTCPHFSTRKEGRWQKYSCRSPGPCPDTACPANPCYQEPDPDGVHT